jgi:dTMP kinase
MALFLEDRAWDVENNILPALRAGRAVIIDRYILSNAAYQGARGPLSPEAVLEANLGFPMPDLTFLLEAGLATCLGRIAARGQRDPNFENEDFLGRVQAVYDRLEVPGLVRLAAAGPKDGIHRRILSAVGRLDPSLVPDPSPATPG